MAEDKFEQAVIEKLKSEGWDYLSEYSGVTVDRLYDHWRDILNANNRKRLEDTPLSDNEFEQVKLELTKNKTPYDAQLMLAGAGGVGTVPLNRDDGTQLELVYHGFEGSLGSTLKAYRTSADSKFVYQYLKRHQDNIYNNYRTPNIPHVQKDFLDVFTISVPRSDEQAKIGSFFNQIDNTIALHQRQLDLLKEQKKGFLQKMFV